MLFYILLNTVQATSVNILLHSLTLYGLSQAWEEKEVPHSLEALLLAVNEEDAHGVEDLILFTQGSVIFKIVGDRIAPSML